MHINQNQKSDGTIFQDYFSFDSNKIAFDSNVIACYQKEMKWNKWKRNQDKSNANCFFEG
jgi:hypothetical protein